MGHLPELANGQKLNQNLTMGDDGIFAFGSQSLSFATTHTLVTTTAGADQTRVTCNHIKATATATSQELRVPAVAGWENVALIVTNAGSNAFALKSSDGVTTLVPSLAAGASLLVFNNGTAAVAI